MVMGGQMRFPFLDPDWQGQQDEPTNGHKALPDTKAQSQKKSIKIDKKQLILIAEEADEDCQP